MLNGLLQWDRALFRLINGGLGSAPLDVVFQELSSLGAWTIAIVALAFLADSGRRVLGRHVLALALGLLIVSPVNGWLKHAVHRPRPASTLAGVRVVDRVVPETRSFPSGHSLTAFFFMTYVAFARRRCRVWALALAALVAFSRVYVGMHYPLDCVAGGALGALGGWVAWLIFRRWLAPPAPAAVTASG